MVCSTCLMPWLIFTPMAAILLLPTHTPVAPGSRPWPGTPYLAAFFKSRFGVRCVKINSSDGSNAFRDAAGPRWACPQVGLLKVFFIKGMACAKGNLVQGRAQNTR
eukprot:1144951-Pelagomonas_calceolata.AAC.3